MGMPWSVLVELSSRYMPWRSRVWRQVSRLCCWRRVLASSGGVLAVSSPGVVWVAAVVVEVALLVMALVAAEVLAPSFMPVAFSASKRLGVMVEAPSYLE